MRQRINIYISKLALEELDKLAQAEGKSRGALMENLVLGARDVEARLKVLEAAVGRLPEQLLEIDEHGRVWPLTSTQQPDDSAVKASEEPPKSGPRVKEMRDVGV